MPKAISYIRFSSGAQSTGSTTERQQKLIQRWLEGHNDIELSPLSQEDLGRSGFKGEHLNHGLGKIIAAIQEDKITEGDFILVEAVDRIGRLEPFEMIRLIQDIVSSGVTIVTLEDGQRYSAKSLNDNMSSLYILIGKIQQAHDYSKSLSRRLKAAYNAKRIRARAGEEIRIASPFWLTTRGKLIPERAEIVKECIDLYLSGHGPRQILLTLRKKHTILDSIHPSTLKRWFQSRALIGEWFNKGKPIKDVFDPLIDLSTFHKLDNEMERRRKEMSPAQTYQLSGIVTCGNCGKRFYFRRKQHRGDVIIYANCSTYLKRGKPFCDNNKTWPYEALLTIFYSSVFVYILGLAAEEPATDLDLEVDALAAKEKEISRNIRLIIDNFLSDMPEQEEARSKVDLLVSEREQIRSELFKLKEKSKDIVKSANLSTHDYFEDVSEDLIDKVIEDPVAFREQLKAFGYRIELKNNQGQVLPIGEAPITFEVMKKSYKYNCYFLRLSVAEHWALVADDPSNIRRERLPAEDFYLAINRKGILHYEESFDRLVDTLNSRRDDELLMYRFADGPGNFGFYI